MTASADVVASAGSLFGSVNLPENTRVYGKSEYEVGFGPTPQKGELWPSDHETLDHFKLAVQGLETTTECRFELPAKFGVGISKLTVLEHIYQEINDQWSNLRVFENGDVIMYIFLTSLVKCQIALFHVFAFSS